ncbi:DUF4097 family beta strand repeat-containing protein [Enterobacter bugandensis]|uniref:hypothetical protein n=1 Tax=Enterobacter bugandensis TaxID=881260 RepID=UPI002362EA1C|nr:hypothetical protein [Enterobacter bugandensis]
MYVNNTSGAQSWNLGSTENTRQSINGIHKSNDNIKLTSKIITGLTESSNGNILLEDCEAKHSDDYHPLSEVLVKSNNGSIKINSNSHIRGSVRNSNGKVSVADSVIEGDIKTSNGNIALKGGCCSSVATSNGKIELTQATVSSVNNSNGKVMLDETTVTGDVKMSNGTLSSNNSKIQGRLEMNSNKFTLGSDSEVNHLKLIHVETLSSASISSLFRGCNITGGGSITINGVSYNNSNLSRRSDTDEAAESVTQYVTLENGARLNHLEFTGEKCILTLEGTAEYTGSPQEKLEIIRA